MKKLSMKQQYHVMTRDLDWDPTYVERNQIYPYLDFEGIKVHDWEAWEDPFRLTMASYYKYQAEKDRRLYAVLESFEQNQSHLRLSDGRYINNMKVFLSGLTPVEYAAHRQFAFLARHLGGPGAVERAGAVVHQGRIGGAQGGGDSCVAFMPGRADRVVPLAEAA